MGGFATDLRTHLVSVHSHEVCSGGLEEREGSNCRTRGSRGARVIGQVVDTRVIERPDKWDGRESISPECDAVLHPNHLAYWANVGDTLRCKIELRLEA